MRRTKEVVSISFHSRLLLSLVLLRTEMPSTSGSLWTCRRRRPYNKSHRNSRSSNLCFRNPCVVFLCSFLALASLRFRVRPKRAAQWIHKHSTQHLRREEKNRSNNHPLQSSPAAVSSDPIVVPPLIAAKSKTANTNTAAENPENIIMEFKLVEEGKTRSGAAFQRYQAFMQEKSVSIQEWTQSMLSESESSSSSSLSSFLNILQTNCPYKAFFFETRPVTSTAQMATKTFEFVLVDAPDLYEFATTRPNPKAFAEYFSNECTTACVFSSLHKDATLIAPKAPPQQGSTDLVPFSHLADFCRKADPDVVTKTWRLAIQTYVQQVERQKRPLWFSTSGLGVSWLHFRVDQRPKYYTYRPFRDEK